MKNTLKIFRALADPTRREILLALKEGELPAGEIASLFSMSAPSVSRHLNILKSAELIVERREGARIIYSLKAEELALCLNDFLSNVCPTQRKKRRKTK